MTSQWSLSFGEFYGSRMMQFIKETKGNIKAAHMRFRKSLPQQKTKWKESVELRAKNIVEK
jgi:hypothetical protein